MNRKQQIKWRLRRLRLRSAVFMRRNGLYLAVAGCLASLGGAAVLIFTAGGNDAPNEPVNRSNDQRLIDAQNTAAAETGTPLPTAETPRTGAVTPAPTLLMPPDGTPMPELSPKPEPTADSGLSGISGLKSPVDGTVIKSFAVNSLLYSETLHQWMTHPGVDIECSKGSEVRTIADGTVENVYVDDRLGVTVVIAHANGMTSLYSNLKAEPPVAVGDRVTARQVIGCIGDTAISECAERSHLHFEIRVNGNPVDPESIITFVKA